MHYARWIKSGDPGGAGARRHARGELICSDDGCDRPATTRGRCGRHYSLWRNSGADPTTPRCIIDGCDAVVAARNWCKKHYQRWVKHGDPLAVDMIIGDVAARFWSHVDKDGPLPERRPDLGPCWMWTGVTNHGGYGRFYDGAREIPAARYICGAESGGLDDGIEPDHLCKNTGCVRPSHLEAVTQRENILRSDGPAAVNARKTHCIHDHEFTPENTLITVKKDGSVRRSCRECGRANDRRHREKKRAERAARTKKSAA